MKVDEKARKGWVVAVGAGPDSTLYYWFRGDDSPLFTFAAIQ